MPTQLLKWAVGVVTSPRKTGYYLDQTLRSLKNAGFDDMVIFAEPNSIIPETFEGHVVSRRKQYGDWTNWASGLYELFLSEPDAEYYLMVEDDCLWCKNTKSYLDYSLPKLPKFAYASLYTPKDYHYPNMRGFHNVYRGRDTWSTVTVVISRDSVSDFLGHPKTMSHRTDFYGSKHENSSKDCVLASWAGQKYLPIYFHSPSLAEHIGVHSTLVWSEDHDYDETNYPQSKDFLGEQKDVSEWVDEPLTIRNQLMITI